MCNFFYQINHEFTIKIKINHNFTIKIFLDMKLSYLKLKYFIVIPIRECRRREHIDPKLAKFRYLQQYMLSSICRQIARKSATKSLDGVSSISFIK